MYVLSSSRLVTLEVNEGVDKQYRTRIENFDPNPLQTGEILVQCPS